MALATERCDIAPHADQRHCTVKIQHSPDRRFASRELYPISLDIPEISAENPIV